MSVLAIGIDSDPTIVYFLGECQRRGFAIEAINVREIAARGSWTISFPQCSTDEIELDGRVWKLAEFSAVYSRLIDLTAFQVDPLLQARWYGLSTALVSWLQTSPAAVVNRPFAGLHNSAKPLHEHLLATYEFNVPSALTTSDPAEMLLFMGNRKVVAKALSGTRADTRLVTESDISAYDSTQGPVHMQYFISGRDVRAHVVGQTVISVLVEAGGVDYRAAGETPTFSPFQLPSELEARLVRATRSLGLAFAGWDFKLDAEGIYWCLEANPQPGYNFYDRVVDGKITDAIMAFLADKRGV
jgi:glutathione synthase/RimK-type ligase-like ATP-grasp enzyme